MARVYQAASMGEARFRVALVERGQADLLVFRVSSLGEAVGDSLWFITRDKNIADSWLFFCSVGLSQLKVCFVSTRGEAGWVNEHPMRGRLR